jgi:hypothetical protein
MYVWWFINLEVFNDTAAAKLLTSLVRCKQRDTMSILLDKCLRIYKLTWEVLRLRECRPSNRTWQHDLVSNLEFPICTTIAATKNSPETISTKFLFIIIFETGLRLKGIKQNRPRLAKARHYLKLFQRVVLFVTIEWNPKLIALNQSASLPADSKPIQIKFNSCVWVALTSVLTRNCQINSTFRLTYYVQEYSHERGLKLFWNKQLFW